MTLYKCPQTISQQIMKKNLWTSINRSIMANNAMAPCMNKPSVIMILAYHKWIYLLPLKWIKYFANTMLTKCSCFLKYIQQETSQILYRNPVGSPVTLAKIVLVTKKDTPPLFVHIKLGMQHTQKNVMTNCNKMVHYLLHSGLWDMGNWYILLLLSKP